MRHLKAVAVLDIKTKSGKVIHKGEEGMLSIICDPDDVYYRFSTEQASIILNDTSKIIITGIWKN